MPRTAESCQKLVRRVLATVHLPRGYKVSSNITYHRFPRGAYKLSLFQLPRLIPLDHPEVTVYVDRMKPWPDGKFLVASFNVEASENPIAPKVRARLSNALADLRSWKAHPGVLPPNPVPSRLMS